MNTKLLHSGNKNLSGKLTCFVALFIFSLGNLSASTNVSGRINSNTAWTLGGSPYIIMSDSTLTISAGDTLLLQPGVEVIFNNYQSAMNVTGYLLANGTSADSIIFSYASGSNGITIQGAYSGGYFRYCRFSHASVAITPFSGAYFSHCMFNSNGMGVQNANANFDTCSFYSNGQALSQPGTVNRCRFVGNMLAILQPNGIVQNSVFLHNTQGISNPGYTTGCVFDSNGICLVAGLGITTRCEMKYNDTVLTGIFATITECNISYNIVGIVSSGNCGVRNDTITYNKFGIKTSLNSDTIKCNLICSNTSYNILATGPGSMSVRDNVWCLPDSALIQPTIFDHHQNSLLGHIYFTPYDTVLCVEITTSAPSLTKSSTSFDVYPNPSNGVFTLQDKSYELRAKSMEVYNVLGEKVYSQLSIVNSQLSINLSRQPSGIYLYRITDDSGKLLDTGKLIVNH